MKIINLLKIIDRKFKQHAPRLKLRDRDYRFTINIKGHKRKSVGIYALDKYVGENRGKFIRKKALKLKVDKDRVIVQGKGYVDIYLR